MLLFGAAMVAIMVWRPRGLLGAARAVASASARRRARRDALLAVEHLSMRFGGLLAVDDVSFAADAGEITAIIGPNGAGKTTVFNCLTGFYRPSVGRLALARGGRTHLLERMDGFRIARDAGVARTFQNIRLFAGMTVLENLIVAQHNRLMRASVFSLAGSSGLPRYRRAEARRDRRSARTGSTRIGLVDARRRRGRQPALWRAAPPRDRARHVHRAGAPVPRRAGGRAQSARDRASSWRCCARSATRSASASC